MTHAAIEGFRLSPQQRRLWQQGGLAFYAQSALLLEGRLDQVALERAIHAVVGRHEILRTHFRRPPGLTFPIQVIADELAPVVRFRDLRSEPPVDQAGRIEEWYARERRDAVDIEQGPIMRACLLALSDEEHLLLLTLPALCADTRTLNNLAEEVGALYSLEGATLADEPFQHVDFSEWQNELLDAVDADAVAGRAYWRAQQGAGYPAVLLPFESSPPEQAPFEPAVLSASLEAELRVQIAAITRAYDRSLPALMLACWQSVLWHLTGQPDIAIQYLCDGRSDTQLDQALGLFARWLPVRCSLEAGGRFTELLGQTYEAIQNARVWQDFFAREEASSADDPPQRLRYPIGFEFEERIPEQQRAGVCFSVYRQGSWIERLKLKLGCVSVAGTLRVELHYDPQIFQAEDIRRMLGYFMTLVRHVVQNPRALLGDLSILPAAERQQLLGAWNDTARAYPQDTCLHQLFEAQVARAPDAAALLAAGESISYRDLNQRANRLAHYLQAQGVGAGSLVGICVERSVDMVVALLAVLKAGGAYVPLAPEYPSARLIYMLEDTGASLLLTQERLLGQFPQYGGAMLCLDRDRELFEQYGTQNPMVSTTPANLAYIVYTSGSTGQPKGVMIAHGSVVNYLTYISTMFELSSADSVLQIPALSFDASVRDIMGPLGIGARVILVSDAEARDPAALLAQIGAYRVSCILSIVPTMLRGLLGAADAGDRPYSSVRMILVSGEVLYAADYAATQAVFGDALRMVNQYGPTECTMTSSYYSVTPAHRPGERLPIGRPIPNAQFYILNRSLAPVPIGATGELYIGGAGLAYGYHNRPDLTAERFVPNPFARIEGRGWKIEDSQTCDDTQLSSILHPPSSSGARLYRTGDLARYRPDGNIEYLGRADQQVKVRGVRVELGEIEAVLRQHSAVREAAVLAVEDTPSELRLVAYTTTDDRTGAQLNAPTAELRAFLQAQLPDHMVPATCVLLQTMPLLPNGKIDRRALHALDAGQPAAGDTSVLPRDPGEELLANLWADILGRERVGIHDDFFALGGHSLLATQLIARANEAFQVELPLLSLFEAPTIAEFATKVAAARQDTAAPTIPPLRPTPRIGALPLSFAQQRLWFFDQLQPGSPTYNIPVTVRLKGTLDLPALHRSLNEIVCRHEALRTTFVSVEGQPLQVIAPAGALRDALLPLPLVDLSDTPAGEREAVAQRMAREEARRPFDLARGPLLRMTLLRLGEDEHIALLNMHHIAADAWSMGVAVQELAALYAADVAGQPASLPPLPIQYVDYAIWQRQWLQGAALEVRLTYWRTQLAALPVLQLPADRSRPASTIFQAAHQSTTLPPALHHALLALSRQEGVTLFMTLLAAFQVLLARYSGQDDIVVGTPIAGRTRAETERLIGCFVNTLVLRTDLSGNPSFRVLLRRVRAVCLGAYAHQELPFEQLVEDHQPARDPSRNPLFQVMFAHQNAPSAPLELPNLTLAPLEITHGTTQLDLTLLTWASSAGLTATLSYSADLFDAATIGRMLAHFQTLLEGIASGPDRPIAMLPLLAESERQQLVLQSRSVADPGQQAEELLSRLHDLSEAEVAALLGELLATRGAE